MADGSRHALRMIPEANYGVTPAAPVWVPIRHTGTTLGLTKESLQSAEIRDDRQITDFRHGAKQVGGDIDVELSYGSFDPILEALLCGTWNGDILKAGVTRRSFTIERYFADILAANKPFHRFTGVEFNSMQLAIAANAIITGKFGVVGKTQVLDTAIIVGSSVAEPSTTEPLDSFTGALKEGGAAVAVVTEIQLNLDNGLDPRFVVGSKETILPSIGRCNVTGQITAYFEDSALVSKFIDEEETSLEFDLPDAAGNNLNFMLPRLKYSGGQPDVAGEGPIMLTMPFQAMRDAAAGSNIVITRTPAA